MTILLMTTLGAAVLLSILTVFAAGRSGRYGRESVWLFILQPWIGIMAMIAELTADKQDEEAQTIAAETTGEADEVYHSITVQAREAQQVVPLGDALRLNTAQQRRGLMMDVLRGSASDYMNVLGLAQKSDDGEVVHYATTALAEQYRKEDTALREARERWKEDPKDRARIRALANAVNEYLQYGAAKGEAARGQRSLYITLMESLVDEQPNIQDYQALIEALMAQEETANARERLAQMQSLYPDSEKVFLLGLRLAWQCSDGQMLNSWLTRARAGEFKLRREGEDALHFWSTQDEEEKRA